MTRMLFATRSYLASLFTPDNLNLNFESPTSPRIYLSQLHLHLRVPLSLGTALAPCQKMKVAD